MSQSVSAIRQDPGGIQTMYSSTFRSSNQADPLLEGEEEKLTTLAPFVNGAVDTESPKQASDNTTKRERRSRRERLLMSGTGKIENIGAVTGSVKQKAGLEPWNYVLHDYVL